MSAITDAIDALLADYWPVIQQRQAAYYAENGVYFQGLPTHTTPPADGAQMQPDNIATTPGDQPTPWPSEDFPVDGLPCSVRLDVYSGNGIAGYTLTAEVVINGELWQRAIDSGADASRVYGWRVATPPDSMKPTPDDLTAISGIGEVREQKLYEMGILTYAQLAAADAVALQDALGPMVSLATVQGWQEQAAKLAEG